MLFQLRKKSQKTGRTNEITSPFLKNNQLPGWNKTDDLGTTFVIHLCTLVFPGRQVTQPSPERENILGENKPKQLNTALLSLFSV